MTLSSQRLLKLALPLIRTHGFTRQALANSVLALPSEEAHSEPLSDTAVSALFGEGDTAQISLVNAWLDEGINELRSVPKGSTLKEVLSTRLQYNEPVIRHLPQAFALMTASRSLLSPLDPRPAIRHSGRIADEACYASGDASLLLEWYAKRGLVATVYTAAELHQMTSPQTAYQFLESLLASSASLEKAVKETEMFGSYIFKSCRGIIKSSGIF